MLLRRLLHVRSLTALAAALCVGASSGCWEALDPCWINPDRDPGNTHDILRTLLSASSGWDLTTINGSPIPVTGFRAPDATARLYAGQLTFQTRDWWGNNKCTSAFESVGTVSGRYDVHLPGAPSQPGSSAGSFHAKHEAGTVIFAAAKATKSGELKGEIGYRTLTVANIRIRNLGDGLYDLVFKERPIAGNPR